MKVFMITKAGAEGISLQNVRYVHMNEPYWHNIRLEQVIGRANRLCSHMYLPEEERNVIAFLYVMHISQEQYDHVASVEMKTKDIGEEGEYPITTDENLLEAATRKERVNKQLLRCIKESSIDCFMHGKDLNCYVGKGDPNMFSWVPSLTNESKVSTELNETTITWKPQVITIGKKKYIMRTDPITKNGETYYEVYDFDSYQKAMLLKVHHLDKDKGLMDIV
jgi:hypothetical protein